MIAAIVGADGAGKSTVAHAVCELLGHHAKVIDRWDIVGSPEYPTADFIGADVRHVRARTALMSPVSRLLFLLWTSVASVVDGRTEGHTDERRDERWSGQGDGQWDGQGVETPESVLLLDGYWMKHAASEIAYGLDQAWVEQVVAGLPGVDAVIYLQSDPETAWDRMGDRAVPYECAMDLSCARPSFIGHQRKIHEVLGRWAARPGWITIDARQPLDAVVDATVRSIGGLRGEG
ncbi:hypothetical protein [Streptosporangium carneum]|uniref:Thymidylate kinase n=1 Tax=Streptosporangium carneum TaxID=47481 RepID=A0A9W6I2M9_9ACTN|nr:hypothetical protein [Streptosporangium carneum]GLK10563.1 hypothetical protein GCM10017600_39690 [Streptosporangium carneum]